MENGVGVFGFLLAPGGSELGHPENVPLAAPLLLPDFASNHLLVSLETGQAVQMTWGREFRPVTASPLWVFLEVEVRGLEVVDLIPQLVVGQLELSDLRVLVLEVLLQGLLDQLVLDLGVHDRPRDHPPGPLAKAQRRDRFVFELKGFGSHRCPRPWPTNSR